MQWGTIAHRDLAPTLYYLSQELGRRTPSLSGERCVWQLWQQFGCWFVCPVHSPCLQAWKCSWPVQSNFTGTGVAVVPSCRAQRCCSSPADPGLEELKEILRPSSHHLSYFLSLENHSPCERTPNPAGGARQPITFVKEPALKLWLNRVSILGLTSIKSKWVLKTLLQNTLLL